MYSGSCRDVGIISTLFWVQKTNPYPNHILILTLTLFQFKVEQFEVVF